MIGMSSRSIVAPHITAWTAEHDLPYRLITIPGVGIGYADETPADRHHNRILWCRTAHNPGEGQPDFGRVHPDRQRRAMLRLLCQVCAGPADKTDDGVLWLLQDHRSDWPGWPNGMGVTEPPICLSCVRISTDRCPALRKGSVAVRARRYPIAGAYVPSTSDPTSPPSTTPASPSTTPTSTGYAPTASSANSTTAPSSHQSKSLANPEQPMDSFDLITALDATIDSLVEPLLTRHANGDPAAGTLALDLGLHLLDRGCSIVARAGLDLAGLDIAVVAAQDRAQADRTPDRRRD